MGDYHDHYLKKDALLLADVFEKFIDKGLNFYGLDPCHYFSSPWLSWDAMLKMAGVKLEQIFDKDKYLFIEEGLNDGISYIAKRYAKAKNKYMKNLKNPNQNLQFTLIWMIFMVGQWVSIFLIKDLSGQKLLMGLM